MKKIGILSSHNGSGFLAIQKAIKDNILDAEVAVVISNNTNARALEAADYFGIPNFYINRSNIQENFIDQTIEDVLEKYDCDYIFLSGYMKKIPATLINKYPNKIINSHPALLPKHGGKGMYGSFIHKAVIEAKDTHSGVTIHFVDEIYDNGEIILQTKIEVAENETAESLEHKVKKLEVSTIVTALQKIINK